MLNQLKSHQAVPLLLLFLGFILHYILPPFAKIWSDTSLFIAVLLHSSNFWGIPRTIVYAVTAMVIGYSAEFIGVHTGWIFGTYHYNPEKNIGLILDVPFSIPIIYAILLYAGNFICLAISKKFLAKKNGWMLALMTGFILMLKDLVSNPLQSTVNKVWLWDQRGDYFNVPLHNFIGWFCVFTLMTFIAVSLSWYKNRVSETIRIDKNIFYFPILLYFSIICFEFTSALTVPDAFHQIGHVGAFISAFVLMPYLLLAWFNALKED